MNREQWLLKVTELLRKEFFNKPPRVLPKLAVSCGIPAGSVKAIGQCWDPKVSKDGTTHIFVCPSIDDGVEVVGTLLHELVHACVGIHHGHKGEFARFARQIGLRGKLTSTFVEPKTDLWDKVQKVLETAGPYPHQAMRKAKLKLKKPKVKRIQFISSTEPDYEVSIAEELVEQFGIPKDPWGVEMIKKGKNEDA